MKKNLYFFGLFFTVFFFELYSSQGQSIAIQPILSQYNSSAPPGITTGIQYRVQQLDANGFVVGYDYPKCKYSWTLTNGKQETTNSTNPVISGIQDIFINWDNVNGNGKAKVVITSMPSYTCPLLGGQTSIEKEVSVPIQYFADLDLIRVNGVPISTGDLACGTNSVTISVPAPTTTYPSNASIDYQWTVTGGGITSGQGTNTITVNPSLNSGLTVIVDAKRIDNTYVKRTKQATITRPNPANLSVTTISSLCAGQTQTATAMATNASGYEWTSTGSVYVNSAQNTGIIGSSAGISATGNGTYSVRAYSSSCQTYSNPLTNNIIYGAPTVPFYTVNSQTYNYSVNGQICENSNQSIYAGASPGTTGYNWSITSGNAYNAYLSAYGNSATFIPYGSGYFNLALDVTNACGTATSNISFYAYSCYSRYAVYPNPAKDYITMEFDKIEDGSSLPELLELLSENSTKPVKSINIQELYQAKGLKNGNILELNTKDLTRGTYYLRISNNKNKQKPINSIRIILE